MGLPEDAVHVPEVAGQAADDGGGQEKHDAFEGAMLAGAAAARVVAVDGLALRVRYELAVGNQVILLLDALRCPIPRGR